MVFGLFKTTRGTTVRDINEKLTRKYDLRPPYQIHLMNRNGNKQRGDTMRLKMPPVANVATLGIGTVAELCEKVAKKFTTEEDLSVKVWDGHKGQYVPGNTRFETIRT